MDQKTIFYLGVEGGGTKSTAILTDEGLNILAQEEGGALNYHILDKEIVRDNFSNLLGAFIDRSKDGELKSVFGLAGMDTEEDKRFYTALVKSILPESASFEILNDSNVALEARCPGEKNRVIVIAGTGSNVYGENGEDWAMVLGWSVILGDEGSGYYFGLQALRAATRSFDGRSEKSVLEEFILEEEGVKDFYEFVPKFYGSLSEGGGFASRVASFAKLVDRAIEKNDKIAMKIRDEGAGELALGVSTVAKKLGFLNEKFAIGFMGSQWKMPGLKEVFKEKVLESCPKAVFSDREDPGAWGAIQLAKKI